MSLNVEMMASICSGVHHVVGRWSLISAVSEEAALLSELDEVLQRVRRASAFLRAGLRAQRSARSASPLRRGRPALRS